MKKVQLVLLIALSVLVYGTVIHFLWDKNSSEVYAAQYNMVDLRTMEPAVLSLTGEKPSVVLFFTSWCPYCNVDAPKMKQLHDKYKEQIHVYGVNLIARDELSEVQAYVERYEHTFPILLEQDEAMYDRLGGSGFPSLYFFSKDGELKEQIIGSTEMEYIETAFKALLE